uniref:EF-hand domain-containing protein n=1 Tax=Guillardia theta TaxID=55529 RepID=A0A6U6B6K6_GUITH|mmetsp:Transcript_3529/g.12349  ORF Transcript_3529/g.12349 Transcript_3529/m.12349 type:complete len:859 (+) Transcript_3529:63-2639(+)
MGSRRPADSEELDSPPPSSLGNPPTLGIASSTIWTFPVPEVESFDKLAKAPRRDKPERKHVRQQPRERARVLPEISERRSIKHAHVHTKRKPPELSEVRSGRKSAPPIIENDHLPVDVWNEVVSKHLDYQVKPHMNEVFSELSNEEQPFERQRRRQFVLNSVQKFFSPDKRSLSEDLDDAISRINSKLSFSVDDQRVKPIPSRTEAMMLQESLELITQEISSSFGCDIDTFLSKAARKGMVEDVLKTLGLEMKILDIIMAELKRQVHIQCQERGEVLDRCHSSYSNAIWTLRDFVLDVSNQLTVAMQTSHEQALRVNELQDMFSRQERLVEQSLVDQSTEESTKQAKQEDLEHRLKTSQLQVNDLNEKLAKADMMHQTFQSKIQLLEMQIKQMERNQNILSIQVNELQERIRKDADTIEFLGETVARYKIRLAWAQVVRYARSQKKPTCDSWTQDGEGIEGVGRIMPSDGVQQAAADQTQAREEPSKHKVGREYLQGELIAFSGFWAGIVRQAEMVDFSRNPDLQVGKKQMQEYISKIYSEKIIYDDIDDRSKLTRQTLPEFLYDYHLEVLGDPRLAEEALVNVVANVRSYDSSSTRIRTFGRFLNLGGQPLPLEALNIFLCGLLRLQNGQLPLLASHDSIQVDAARGLRVIEYVFAQTSSIVRSKVLLEAEKMATGKHIDVDHFLLFIIEEWKQEVERSEERLRALFVASDADGDGNLDFEEFAGMVARIQSNKEHRELLRMYSEMTLNKQVDCNTFVRVCRKFRFFTFETGPVSKKVDPAAKFVFDLILEEVDASAPSHLRLILAVGRAGGQARRARHHFARHADLKPSEGGKSPLLARSLSSARVDDDLLEAQAY